MVQENIVKVEFEERVDGNCHGRAAKRRGRLARTLGWSFLSIFGFPLYLVLVLYSMNGSHTPTILSFPVDTVNHVADHVSFHWLPGSSKMKIWLVAIRL